MPFSIVSPRHARVWIGAAFWSAVVVCGVYVVGRAPEARTALARVAAHVAHPSAPIFEAEFPKWAWVKPGHLVRIEHGDEFLVAGEVREAVEKDGRLRVSIAVYPEFARELKADAKIEAVQSSGDMSWIVKTLLPPERMDAVKKILADSWNADKERLWRDLEPGLTRLTTELTQVLREDTPRLLEERREEFLTLGDVLRERAWEGHLQDVFVKRVWPSAENHAMPVLAKIADEIAQQAPVVSLSWSYVRGRLPFGDDESLRRKVREFIDREVIPIVARHRDELKDGAVKTIADALKDPVVVDAFERSFADVIADARFRKAAKTIFESWIVDNARLSALLKGAFERDDIRRPIAAFFDARGPDIEAIANLIILDPKTQGISPDLARVLRLKILGEGRSWLYLTLGTGAPKEDRRLLGVVGGEK